MDLDVCMHAWVHASKATMQRLNSNISFTHAHMQLYEIRRHARYLYNDVTHC